MNKSKLLKGAGLVALTAMLPLSQAAADTGNWGISGWINQGMTYVDDGVGSDIISYADNGNTLGSRVILNGSTDLPNSGLTAGFTLAIEPLQGALGIGTAGTGTLGLDDGQNPDTLNVLEHNVHIAGSFGKITLGQQSMPTDNIAVLEDPSLTLWASISPIFRGNGTLINSGTTVATMGGAADTSFGDFANCYTFGGLRGNLGIGIDCNGAVLDGIRYDLPAFGPVTVAVGYANDDIYDIAAKWKGDLGGLKASVALGYAINQSNQADGANSWDEAENFQMQAGLMDPGTGIFGSIAYQHESVDLNAANTSVLQDDTDAYWLKVGIKKAFNSLGDTSFAFQYGSYNDQYGTVQAAAGVGGSELERIGFEVNQYFGSRLIVYGVWENLEANVDAVAAGCATCANLNAGDDYNHFTTGLTFFF